MRTKKITLFYKVSRKAILPPDPQAMRRKDEWIKEIQRTLENSKPVVVKLTYEISNPQVQQQIKFFNGPVVAYYAIQDLDMMKGEPDRKTIETYRETILDELLGYTLELAKGKMVRRRRSTADFLSTQKWHDFLESVREGLFDQMGYEFPDSERFWAIAEEVGYLQAKKVAIRELQEKMKRKTKTASEQ